MNLHLDQDSPVISSITNFKNKLDEERMRSVAERKRLEDEVRKLKEEKKKMQEDFSQRLSDTKKQQWVSHRQLNILLLLSYIIIISYLSYLSYYLQAKTLDWIELTLFLWHTKQEKSFLI